MPNPLDLIWPLGIPKEGIFYARLGGLINERLRYRGRKPIRHHLKLDELGIHSESSVYQYQLDCI